MIAKVSIDGQVALPREIRDLLGVLPGDTLLFEDEGNGRVRMVKASTGPHDDEAGEKDAARASRFDGLHGVIDLGMTTDEFMKMMRGDE